MLELVRIGEVVMIKGAPAGARMLVGWNFKPDVVLGLFDGQIKMIARDVRKATFDQLNQLATPGVEPLLCIELKILDCSVVRTGQRLFNAGVDRTAVKTDGTAWMLHHRWNDLIRNFTAPVETADLVSFKIQDLIGVDSLDKVIKQFTKRLRKL